LPISQSRDHHIPNSTIDTTLQYRQRSLSLLSISSALLHAANNASEEIRLRGDGPLRLDHPLIKLHDDLGHVALVMHPSVDCLWSMWGTTVKEIMDFVDTHAFKEINFDIHETGTVAICDTGTGRIFGLGYMDGTCEIAKWQLCFFNFDPSNCNCI